MRHNVYYLLLIMISGFVLCVLGGWGYVLQDTWPNVIPTRCLTDISLVGLMTVLRIYVALDIYIGPNVLSLLASVFLFVTVRLQFAQRSNLQSPGHAAVSNGQISIKIQKESHEHVNSTHPAHSHLAGALTAIFQVCRVQLSIIDLRLGSDKNA